MFIHAVKAINNGFLKKTYDGSLLVSMLILFIFMSTLIGIVIRNATLFSSLVLKKQMYTTQAYAADALLQYGIAYVQDNYDTIIKNLQDSVKSIDYVAIKQSPVLGLLFYEWPITVGLYAGIITIEQAKEKEDAVDSTVNAKKLTVQAFIYEKEVLSKDLALPQNSTMGQVPTLQIFITQPTSTLSPVLNTHLLQHLKYTIFRQNNVLVVSSYVNVSS